MLQAQWGPSRQSLHRHPFTRLEDISPYAGLAVIAGEDQRFPSHHGFDMDAIGKAIGAWREGGHLRGASTLSQQTAKNLFLWQGRSWVRKALESYFTVLIEATWPKRRILEVYLNIAEFGPGVYGIHAASRYYFDRQPSALTRHQAAQLAAVLPNPTRRNLRQPSQFLRQRIGWIELQMQQLGGTGYLCQHALIESR